MGKKAKIKKLRDKVSIKIQRVMCLLDKIIYASDDTLEKDILAQVAYDETKKMDKFNEKIDKYL